MSAMDLPKIRERIDRADGLYALNHHESARKEYEAILKDYKGKAPDALFLLVYYRLAWIYRYTSADVPFKHEEGARYARKARAIVESQQVDGMPATFAEDVREMVRWFESAAATELGRFLTGRGTTGT